MVMAEIYTLTGDYDKAVDQIEYLLTIPAPISESSVGNNTIFKPLKNNPRFRQLMKDI